MVETLGTHEGPGLRLVLFLQGCGFRCVYCHNPETQALVGGKPLLDVQVLELAERQKTYIQEKGGVTFSGGEPLLQAKQLIPVCQRLQEQGFHVALDTAGPLLTEEVKELLRFVDLVLLDVKHIDDEQHKKVTGVSNSGTLSFAQYLEEKSIPFWLRYVLVPGFTDQLEAIDRLGRHFCDFKCIERCEVLPFHTYGAEKYRLLGRPNPCEGVLPPSNEQVQVAVDRLLKYFPEVIVR